MLLEPRSADFKYEVLCLACIFLVSKLAGTQWMNCAVYLRSILNKLTISKSEVLNCELWVLTNVPPYFAQIPDFTQLLLSFCSAVRKNRNIKVDERQLWLQSTSIYINASQSLSLSDILSPLTPQKKHCPKTNQHFNARMIKVLRHVQDKARLLKTKPVIANKLAILVRS